MRKTKGRARPAWVASLVIHGMLVAATGWWLADQLERTAAPAAPTPLKMVMFQAPEPVPTAPVEPEPEPVQEPPPPQAIPEPVPEPPPPPVERPTPKPAPAKPKPSPPKVAPPRPSEPVAPAEAVRPPVQATVPAPPAPVPAAPALAAVPMPPAPDPALEASYRDRIRQAVDAHKHYPRMARRLGVEGRVVLAFTLRDDGRLAEVHVAESSGSELLDEAALQAVRDAAPFPPFPDGIGRERWDFTLPLYFALNS